MVWMHWPLDDADLEAVAGGVCACDGGRCTTAVAGAVVACRVRGVDGRISGDTVASVEEAVVADENEVGTAGVFLRHEESQCHRGEGTRSRQGAPGSVHGKPTMSALVQRLKGDGVDYVSLV